MKVVYNECFGGFSISRACAQWMADHGNKECMDMVLRPDEHFYGDLGETTPRHDALLVMAVEHLGQEKASGDCAALVVHELKGDRYFIDEYDGSESVVEPHSLKWVKV